MDIDSRLRAIGLAQYAEIFRTNDIDGELLALQTNADLKEIGVASFAHRKKTVFELGEVERHVGFHYPVRYKSTDWSRAAAPKERSRPILIGTAAASSPLSRMEA